MFANLWGDETEDLEGLRLSVALLDRGGAMLSVLP